MEEQPRFGARSEDPLGATASLDAALARWVAAVRADDAADQRRRQGWLERQAGADTTFSAVLAGHAERGERVALTTTGGATVPGRVRAVGADVVVLVTPGDIVVLVALAAVATVRTAGPGHAGARSDGPLAPGDDLAVLDATFAELLAELAPERPEVSLTLGAGGVRVRGELRRVGRDTCLLRADGDAGWVHVALATLTECRLG